jgi:hypothetical protein
MPKAIEIYTRQLDPSSFEGSNWAAQLRQQFEAVVPHGQLPHGSEAIVIHRDTRHDAVQVAKARVKKLLAGRGPVRFKVIGND